MREVQRRLRDKNWPGFLGLCRLLRMPDRACFLLMAIEGHQDFVVRSSLPLFFTPLTNVSRTTPHRRHPSTPSSYHDDDALFLISPEVTFLSYPSVLIPPLATSISALFATEHRLSSPVSGYLDRVEPMTFRRGSHRRSVVLP